MTSLDIRIDELHQKLAVGGSVIPKKPEKRGSYYIRPFHPLYQEFGIVESMTTREYKDRYGDQFIHLTTSDINRLNFDMSSEDGPLMFGKGHLDTDYFRPERKIWGECGGFRLIPISRQHEWTGNTRWVPQYELSMIDIPDEDQVLVMKNGSIQVGRFSFRSARYLEEDDTSPDNGHDEEYYMKVVEYDSPALIFVPDKKRTQRVCKNAVIHNYHNIKHVPDELVDEEMAIRVVTRDRWDIDKLPERLQYNEKVLAVVNAAIEKER